MSDRDRPMTEPIAVPKHSLSLSLPHDRENDRLRSALMSCGPCKFPLVLPQWRVEYSRTELNETDGDGIERIPRHTKDWHVLKTPDVRVLVKKHPYLP